MTSNTYMYINIIFVWLGLARFKGSSLVLSRKKKCSSFVVGRGDPTKNRQPNFLTKVSYHSSKKSNYTKGIYI